MTFPVYRYKSKPIDTWCLECYKTRHAPLRKRNKRIDGQYKCL